MKLPEFVISLGGSLLLFIILFCLSVAATIFFYRTTIPPMSPHRRRILILLRALALTVLLFLLFEPLLKIIFRQEQKPVLAVLIDDSESMMIKDKMGERSAQVRMFLQDNPFSRFTDGDLLYYRFSSRLNKFNSFAVDSLAFKGETTDLAEALATLKEMVTKENIQAAILISDGNYTVGKNPLSIAEELGIPLYAVGIGDTTEQRDVLIAKVTTNNIAYAETRVPVDVRVRSSGYKNENVEVTLTQGAAILDRKLLQLQEGTRDYALALSYEAKEEGMQRYAVRVSTLPGELTEKNNTTTFFVKVLKTKLRILLIAGAPSPDIAAVRQALSEEQHFTVKSLVQKSEGEFYEGTLTQQVIDSADCFVLIGYPSSAASLLHVQKLLDAVTQEKKPILFIASRTLDFSKLQLLASALPFTWTAPSPDELLVFANVPEKQRMHVLVNLEGSVTIDSWHQLPPIYKTQTVFHAKPEAEVLAFAQPDRGSPERPVRTAQQGGLGRAGQAGKIQSVVLTEPLVLVRNIARQKSLAITGHGVWRWRLLAQGNPQTEKFLSLLLTNAVRWLTTLDEGKKVRVAPTKDAFTSTEAVEFTGEVYDEQFRPVDNAELRVEITSKGQRYETLLRTIGSGRYEGGIEGLSAGDYNFTARATLDGKALGEDKGKFSVGQMNVEFLQTKMNKQLLDQLAFHTGGAYMNLAQAASLIDTIRAHTTFTSKELSHASELELWNWQYLAAFIMLLLGIEWFVRKRSGML